MMSFEIWDLQYLMPWKLYFVVFKSDTTERVWKVFFLWYIFSPHQLFLSSQVIFSLGSDGLRASSEVHWGLNWAVKIKGSVSLTHTHTHTSGTGTSWKKFLHKSWHEVSQANLSEKQRGWEKEKERKTQQTADRGVERAVMFFDWLNRWCNGRVAALWGQQRASITITWH